MAKRSDDFSTRIRIIALLFFLVAAGLVYRLFDLQVIQADRYREKAERQYRGSQVKPLLAGRGAIYFREKSGKLISAAVVKQGFKLVIDPSKIKNAEEVYKKISMFIPVSRDKFFKSAGKKNDAYEEIARYLDHNRAQEIGKLDASAVAVVPDQWRFYPGGKLASHILGYVGYNKDEFAGQYGVEKFYDDYLRGVSGNADANSFSRAFLGISRELFSGVLSGNNDIVLTIEPSVEGFLESSLEKILSQYSAESAGGIIMEPKTGKILAMAAKPDFDPNFYNKVEDHSLFSNPLVSGVFEMGSVMKPITLSGAIDRGSIKPETTYYDNGYLIINKARIENYDGKARGKVDMQTVLNKSLNTGAVFAMRQLGKNNFRDYVAGFGLGEKTGVNLPDEAKGNIASLNSPREIEFATASFGQGVAFTPVGFAAAFSALANGGYLVRPYIVETNENQPVIKRQIIKKETSEEITRMLAKVVDEALLEGTVKIKHYSAAAKTGTAQISQEDKRGYSEDYLHAFVGYAPAFDAKFLVFLYLKKPVGVQYASHSLTPAFMDIIQFLLTYYEVPPDR